ncbi:MAG: DUF1987 domain-containing protein [Bacteroidetes bacterium]|nr:DUF1987 domain-containing protein [Bacteroidota bacterium]
MEPLKIAKGTDTPEIILDAQNNLFSVSGRSYPEDTREFFTPVLNWIDRYVQSPNHETLFVFQLQYFNSSSYKPIFDILTKLESVKEKGKAAKINWQYKKGDRDMREAGEEFAELCPSIEFLFNEL